MKDANYGDSDMASFTMDNKPPSMEPAKPSSNVLATHSPSRIRSQMRKSVGEVIRIAVSPLIFACFRGAEPIGFRIALGLGN